MALPENGPSTKRGTAGLAASKNNMYHRTGSRGRGLPATVFFFFSSAVTTIEHEGEIHAQHKAGQRYVITSSEVCIRKRHDRVQYIMNSHNFTLETA